MHPDPPVTIDDIRAARDTLAGVIGPTPMEHSRALSDVVGVPVHLKCENLQRAGSFKIRGAYTRMAGLSPDERRRGVVAASAGNHAQGVALAARMLRIEATVYMPAGAAMPKLLATRGYGATVHQVGSTIDECIVAARGHEEQTGAVFVPPFDHPDIVAGQGTCGLEILDQVPDVATVVVCTGGGGLLGGVATAVRAARPGVRVIGVQAEQAAAWPASLAAGHPVALRQMRTMADGIAVGRPGDVPFAVLQQWGKDLEIATVGEDEIARALLFCLERARLVVEPAGAAAVAHLLSGRTGTLRGPVVAILSGGNVDPLLLLRIIRTGLSVSGRYLELTVRVPDSPGSLAQLLADLAEERVNVLDVQHGRTDASLRVQEVQIAVTVETEGHEHSDRVRRSLREQSYLVASRTDLTTW